jgi:hypothetical protein
MLEVVGSEPRFEPELRLWIKVHGDVLRRVHVSDRRWHLLLHMYVRAGINVCMLQSKLSPVIPTGRTIFMPQKT